MTEPNIPLERNYAEADDAQLVAWTKDDSAAFGELYRRYVRKIYNYVYYRTGNHHDAEDLTSRVFFRALAHVHNYTDRGVPFSAWLYRIAHNLVANWHRDRGRKKIVPLDEQITSSMKSEAPEALAERIQHTMSEVTPSEQFVRRLGVQLATAPTVVPSRSLWGRVRHLPPRVQLAAGIGGATLTAGVVLLISRTLVPGALESWRNRRTVTA